MHKYMVVGDLSSEKSSEAYPVMCICDDCIGDFNITTEEGECPGPCEVCGKLSKNDDNS
jgi:hypothetical protein